MKKTLTFLFFIFLSLNFYANATEISKKKLPVKKYDNPKILHKDKLCDFSTHYTDDYDVIYNNMEELSKNCKNGYLLTVTVLKDKNTFRYGRDEIDTLIAAFCDFDKQIVVDYPKILDQYGSLHCIFKRRYEVW